VNARKQFSVLALTGAGGETLTSLRMTAGLTQGELAKQSGVSQEDVELAEAGGGTRPSQAAMLLQCKVLNCSLETLDTAYDNAAAMLAEWIVKQASR
jgi:transcriptional regulator with XRE-family HTH domain